MRADATDRLLIDGRKLLAKRPGFLIKGLIFHALGERIFINLSISDIVITDRMYSKERVENAQLQPARK